MQDTLAHAQSHSRYESPLSTRYAGLEMQKLFSAHRRIATWRQLWIALARAQQELGLSITDGQLKELESSVNTIDFNRAREHERITRHDVMAHILTYGEQCPTAKGIIHLGATSCYVTDNADLIVMREAMQLIRQKLLLLMEQLSTFSQKHAALPCLAYTHLQPAQPTTVGKRASLWLQDLLSDFHDLSFRLQELPFLGAKGATGTQASFLSLFDGDTEKVLQLDRKIASAFNFEKLLTVSGQTYPRKIDAGVLDALAALATTAHKWCNDIRLLAHLEELGEPWRESKEGGQVGSSAMPYKRNPILAERCCSLSRYLISLSDNPRYTAATQWFERTLDDSANRRLSIPEAFLSADAILNLLITITNGWVIYPEVIARNLQRQLPFMATEEILMQSVQRGGDRQKLHERLRQHSQAAAEKLRSSGGENDLFERLTNDEAIPLNAEELAKCLDLKRFIGCAPLQVERFIAEEVAPALTLGDRSKALDTEVDI